MEEKHIFGSKGGVFFMNHHTTDNHNSLMEVKKQYLCPDNTNLLIVSEEKLFVFFSVDICNSTRLKSKNKKWFEANKLLYNEQFGQLHFWKYNGDEVLYAEPFSDIQTLVSTINNAYDYIKYIQNEIKRILGDETFQLKGTIWLARTSADTNENPNLHVKSLNLSNDFLGGNIDEGFRLTQKITGSKIVIDPKIIYLLIMVRELYQGRFNSILIHKTDLFCNYARNRHPSVIDEIKEVLTRTQFINYTHLKGVWDNRRYPIFWFYKDDYDYAYDEMLDDNYVEAKPIKEEDWCKQLEKIFISVNAKKEVLNILSIIASETMTDIYKWESFARLYYAVACINPNTGNILICQRSNQRQHLKGVWEFVPFKHTSKEIVNSIKKRINDDFGIEINLITDNEKEENIIPIHFCTIYRNGQAHNSLLCMARIIDECKTDEEIISKLRQKVNSQKYRDFRFVNANDIDNYEAITLEEIAKDSLDALSNKAIPFKDNKVVMYFQNSIFALQSYYEKLSNGYKWYELYKKEGKD